MPSVMITLTRFCRVFRIKRLSQWFSEKISPNTGDGNSYIPEEVNLRIYGIITRQIQRKMPSSDVFSELMKMAFWHILRTNPKIQNY